MTNLTCKDCPERHEACHDHCERFTAWRKQHEAEADYNRRMMKSAIVYHSDGEDRHRAKGRKRYFGANGGADR